MKQHDLQRMTRHVRVRLTEREYEQLNTAFKRTTKRKLSEYIRALLLGRPVTIYTRNRSLDELMPVLLQLRKELSAIGNNYNQAVHKLHTLSRSPDAVNWAKNTEHYHQLFEEKQAEISRQISRCSDQWLHG
ncbi:MAG: hypothetical protein DI535_03775 [Citrobacter freundii]|nr:MAG: hypothetical protein DI535_03775 [Citrobacter freundii]